MGWGKLVPMLAILIVLLNFGRTTWYLFNIWPNNEEVQFVWQAAFTDIAEFLDNSEIDGPVGIGGWTPETMDPPTMTLLLGREDLNLRYFDPTQSLILPTAAPGETGRLAKPAILPLASELEQKLLAWGLETTTNSSFTIIPFTNLSASPIQFPYENNFGGEIIFLGYDLLEPSTLLAPGTHRLLTYWQVERPTNEPRRFFLHLVNEGGRPIAQQDTLGAPAEHWQPGDLIVQLHTLEVPVTDGSVGLLLGIYNPVTNERLTTGNADAVRLNNS